MDDGQHIWSDRSHVTINMLEQERPDVFGVQEVLTDQIAFLEAEYPEYGRVGVGRDDCKAEYSTSSCASTYWEAVRCG